MNMANEGQCNLVLGYTIGRRRNEKLDVLKCAELVKTSDICQNRYRRYKRPKYTGKRMRYDYGKLRSTNSPVTIVKNHYI